MALSRLIRPLHVGASMMSCIIAQRQRIESVPIDQIVEGCPILDNTVGSKSASAINTTNHIHTNKAKREKELINRQACDASGNLFHRFYFQEP